jgi:hypothetical protein
MSQYDSLIVVLEHEAHIIRELLSNLEEERQSHLMNRSTSLIQVKKALIARSLANARILRQTVVKELTLSHNIDKIDLSEKDFFYKLIDINSSEGCQALVLRDQIISLLKRLKSYKTNSPLPVKQQAARKLSWTKTY